MGDAAAAIAGVVGAILFVEVFLRLGTVGRTTRLLGLYRRAIWVVTSRRISDHWKERVVGRYAILIIGLAIVLILMLAAAVAVPVGVALLWGVIGASWQAGVDMLSGWTFNLAAVAGGIAYAVVRGLVVR